MFIFEHNIRLLFAVLVKEDQECLDRCTDCFIKDEENDKNTPPPQKKKKKNLGDYKTPEPVFINHFQEDS